MTMRQVHPIQVWWTETVEIHWFRERDGRTEYRLERRTCPPYIWDSDGMELVAKLGEKETT